MNFNFLFTLFLAILAIHASRAYKIGILVPDMVGSQIVFNQRVAAVLASAGHNVTLIRIQMMPYKDVKSTTHPGVTEWFVNGIDANFDSQKFYEQHSVMEYSETAPIELFKIFGDIIVNSCNSTIHDEEFIAKLKNEKFDVLFGHFFGYCSVGLQKVAGVRSWISLNSGAVMDYVAQSVGLYVQPSFAPPLMMDASDRLTIVQRFKSIIGHTITPLISKYLTASRETKLFRAKFGADFPDLFDLASTASLVFANSDELYDLPRQTLHKIINIGGIGMQSFDAKPLPDEIQSKVDAANAVVVFTFGSVANATLMPLAWKQAFMAAFGELRKDIVVFMRYNTPDMDDFKPDNVVLSKWLPQADLLRHPKTRVFITHGGYNGVQEAINAAKPIITVPLFGDQFRNSRIAEKHGFGIVLPKSNVSKDAIVAAIRAALDDPSYSAAAHRMASMVSRRPISPSTLLIRWTEFAAEFGPLDNLRPVSAELGLVTLYNLDIYGGLLLVFFILTWITWRLISWIWTRAVGPEKIKFE